MATKSSSKSTSSRPTSRPKPMPRKSGLSKGRPYCGGGKLK